MGDWKDERAAICSFSFSFSFSFAFTGSLLLSLMLDGSDDVNGAEVEEGVGDAHRLSNMEATYLFYIFGLAYYEISFMTAVLMKG